MSTASVEPLSAREFGEALIAAMAAQGTEEITGTQPQVHRAFRNVLTELTANTNLAVDLSDVDYDPLYGLSGWLDEFLARAQRDLLISFPNPSYDRIEIKLTRGEGEEHLSQYKNDAEVLKRLSSLFVNELQV